MPRITDIAILSRPETPTLSIRTKTSVNQLPMLIGQSYGKLGAYLAQQGEFLADIPFVCYHNMDMQNLDVEMGLPLPKALPGNGDIQLVTIPARKSVSCTYIGPYGEEMVPVYDEMGKWIADNGYEAVGTAYEYYYNGPEYPESQLLTRIEMPLK